MAKDYKRTNAYKELKNSLIKQLEEKNNANDYFMDLVEDYMRLWVIKNQLNDVLVDEENAFDSMPEGLQVSEIGMNSEESIDLMYDIKDKLEQCIDNINDTLHYSR